MARLHADEHIPPGIVFRLRLLGHTVDTVRELVEDKYGEGLNDRQVLLQASRHRAAVVTKNVKDCRVLHDRSGDHFGIIACTFCDTADPKRIAKLIDDAIKSMSDLRGQWLRVKH